MRHLKGQGSSRCFRGLGSEMVRNDTKTIRLFKQHPTSIVNSRPLSTTPSEVWALQASFNNPFRGFEPSRPPSNNPFPGAPLNLIGLRRGPAEGSLMSLCLSEGVAESKNRQNVKPPLRWQKSGLVQATLPKAEVPSTNPFG